MTKITGAYILASLSIIILTWNIYELDFENLQSSSYSRIISSSLLVLLMIVSIRDLNKLKEK